VEEVEKMKIKWEWEEITNDFDEDKYFSCKKCSYSKDDPECPHSCERYNSTLNEVLSILKQTK